jgi:micrococcal nuclease
MGQMTTACNRMNWAAGFVAAALLVRTSSAYAEPVSPEDAVRHVGESATVCGVMASAKFAANSRSQPTSLDLGKPYPNALFTAVIFGSDRPKFDTPETSLRGKRVCVTGQIRDYRGKPEIIVSDPSQLAQ